MMILLARATTIINNNHQQQKDIPQQNTAMDSQTVNVCMHA